MEKEGSNSLMNGISISVSNLIKCIACLVIALHHYAQMGIDKGFVSGPIYSAFRSVGGDLSVTLFFLLSGYGLIASETKRHLGFVDFMKKRLWRLLMPFWIANVIFVVLYWIFGVGNVATISIVNALLSGIGIIKFDNTMWFVHVLIMLYFCFAVASQIKGKTLLYTSIFSAIFIAVSILLGMGSYFWSSVFAFPVGIALYQYKDTLFPIARKLYVPILGVIVYAGLLYLLVFKLNLDNSIWHQLNNILIVILLVSGISHLSNDAFVNFKLPKWLDAYYEVYLVHPKIIYFLLFGFGVFLPLPVYLVVSIGAAILLHAITSLVDKK